MIQDGVGVLVEQFHHFSGSVELPLEAGLQLQFQQHDVT